MTINNPIRAVDHRIEVVARALHSVQMLAYAQEAKLLEAKHFPPLLVTVEDIRISKEQFIAAFDGDQIVGAISVEVDNESSGWGIASLVVDPLFQKRGIASLLISEVVKSFGGTSLSVQTGAKNLPALSLYKRHSFIEFSRFFVDDHSLELVQLRRGADCDTAQ
jgi:ribosomal protein S18 acetylase RimI-like enzyme